MKALRTIALTVCWTALAVTLFVIAVLTTAVKALSPERLTPLVSRIASGYLDADVQASRIELTFWSTFPRLTLETDSLLIVSRSLSGLSTEARASIPADADSLFSLGRLEGSINIAQLPLGRIALYDVTIERPMVNLVSVNDSVANYNILPPSRPDTSRTEFVIPDISINRFKIADAQPIKYTSIADSLHVVATIQNTELHGHNAPTYRVGLNGDFATPLLRDLNFDKIDISLDGQISWHKKEPNRVSFSEFAIGIDEYQAQIDTDIDFADNLTLETLKVKLKPISVANLLTHTPIAYRQYVAPLHTDMKVELAAELTRPYTLTDSATLPSVKAQIKIPDCKAQYGQATLRTLALDADINFDGEQPDRSSLTLKRLIAEGPATLIDITGTVTSPMSDPAINAKAKVSIAMERFPDNVRRLIPARVDGRLNADMTVKARLSQLTRERFHKILADGELHLDNFSYATDSLTAWVNRADVKFGTSKGFVRDTHRVDSLLAVSLAIDTASYNGYGYTAQLSHFKGGAGCANRFSSTDTSAINPMGGRFTFGRLTLISEIDTMRLRMRDVDCAASLRRFRGGAKVPQLGLRFTAGRVGLGNAESRYSLRDSEFNIRAHLNTTKRMGRRTQQIYDSLLAVYPAMADDAIANMARELRRRERGAASKVDADELIDFGLERSTRDLLRRWEIKGELKAKRGRAFTPYFPLRNRLTDIDLRFSMDSVIITDTHYKVGQSDFTINGTISNLRRALTSRRGSPLKIDFVLRSDTINVNEIVRTIYAGSAYDPITGAKKLDVHSDDDEAAIDKAISQEDTSAVGAFIVPHNIDAHLRMAARNVIYADMTLHRFRGDVYIRDGAINLDRLSARTDIGALDMTALYQAPDKRSMAFGFGMTVRDFHLERFMRLFPDLDSIMPMLSSISGIVNADIAATTDVDTAMNFVIPTLKAVVKIEGDSLVLLDDDTFRTISKWLMFKNKKHNMIDHMSVEMVVEDQQLELFPFMFDIDRYRLGVMGHNDLALNLDYHISVLKSPLPFKFGVNIKGNVDDMKIRLGGAKFKENMVGQRVAIVDTTRINLLNQIQQVFRRGVNAARLGSLDIKRSRQSATAEDDQAAFSRTDSLLLIREGLIDAPPPIEVDQKASRKQKKKK